MQLDHLVLGPAGDLLLGHLGDEAVERLHLLAVERGEHQLALREVRALVQQDDRIAPDDRLEDLRALARVQDVGRRGEDLPDLVRVGHHHERRRTEETDREAPAVARAGPLEIGGRARPPPKTLQRRWGARTGWQV
jgi:hypothetical protein